MSSHSYWAGSRWGKKKSNAIFFHFCYLCFKGSWAALLYEQVMCLCVCVCVHSPYNFCSLWAMCLLRLGKSKSCFSHNAKFESKVTLICRNSAHTSSKTCSYLCASSWEWFLSQVGPRVSGYGDSAWSSCSQVTLAPLQHNPSLFLPCWFWAPALLCLDKTDCKG